MDAQTYTHDELSQWQTWFDALDTPGPYHAPEYLSLLAGEFEHDSEQAELFVYGDDSGFVYYPYLRRSLENLPYADIAVDNPEQYSDIVSSWYYGGPLLSPDADISIVKTFTQIFREHCRENNIISEFVRFDPNLRNDRIFDTLNPVHNRQTIPIDLTQSKEKIWERYESRNQRAIRQARKSPVNIDREYSVSDIKQFHTIYMNAMDSRDAAEHYRFPLQFFKELITSEFCSPVIARHSSDVVGGFLIAHDDICSHHYLSASNPEYWDDRVNNLMYHRSVMYMHDTGRKVFDFQGGRPGVFKFKKGYSPARREFYIAKRVHQPEIYDALVDAAASAGVETDTGYFPAYRIEQSN
jgi:hypothetical protein